MQNTHQSFDAVLPIEPHPSWLKLDDEDIGTHFWAWFIMFVFDRTNVNLADECKQKDVEQVLSDNGSLLRDLPRIALDLDQDDEEGVILEKAAKLCVRCELSRAGKLIRNFIETREDVSITKAENATVKEKQRIRAEKQRPTPLTKRVDAIVAQRPDISELELLGRLTDEIGNGLIESVEDDEYVWLDDKGKDKKCRVSGLKDVLYKSKFRLKKNQRGKQVSS